MHFDAPWAFALLLLIPVVLRLKLRRRSGSVRFSSVDHAARAGMSLRRRLLSLPLALRALALVLLVIAIARPQKGIEQVRDLSKGVAIEMVVDRSGSMAAEMEYMGQRMNRLQVVKEVFEKFMLGNGKDLKGRPNDLIGMVAFARYPDTVCPLTLGHGVLSHFLKSVGIVKRRNEDGTAIGDAMALAAARLKTAEDTMARQTKKKDAGYDIKSKVMIVLTDGVNNCGERQPMEAAQLAAKWGIKIYTIGVGGDNAVTTVQTPFGNYKMPVGQGVDEDTLKAIAKATGGRYWRVDDARSLEKVYEKIDKLERSEIESVRYLDYREMFMPFALAGLLLLALEMTLACTIFRRIP